MSDVGQVALEDSNVALMNSDLAKSVREAAAQFEPEWEGAGKQVGIEIWRSENLGVKRWEKKEYGKFFDGDSYIVLNTYKAPEGDKLLHNVHFWLGQHTSQDEAGVAAYKTVELDDLLGQLPVQFREVMGHESTEFLALFKPSITILKGGIASGFNHVEATAYAPRLMHCKGPRKSVRVTEVPLSRDSLNDGDVFVLDNGLQLYQWNGTQAGVFEKRQGQEIVSSIKSDRNGKPESLILDGEEECEPFWELLGGKGPIKPAVDDTVPLPTGPASEKAILRLSDDSGSLTLTDVPFSKSELHSQDVFLVNDRGLALYIWVGADASKEERSRAFQYANQYISKNKLPMSTPVSRVLQGQTTASFEAVFA